jgi:hypothetical protein
MVTCVFTIDYEVYGNGEGDLRELVFDPTRELLAVFDRWNAKMVNFVEAAEFEKIEDFQTDSAVSEVRAQIREMCKQGHEIALHLHPQWFNARPEGGRWVLDYAEYSLCVLPPERISALVRQAIAYLSEVIGDKGFKPLSFRAGNWLFQPTDQVAAALAREGIRIDSSVFKGGRQSFHGLDYRRSQCNPYFWTFSSDVNLPDPDGAMLEIPIYTKLVPFWRMVTGKRLDLQRKGGHSNRSLKQRVSRLQDLARFSHPLKFDFCRMTLEELTTMVGEVLAEDQRMPEHFRPMVMIGHSKDLVDFETIERFLDYLARRQIEVATLEQIYDRCFDQIASYPPPISTAAT